jgi:NhaP-type Na+/H+ or K+/H+ antiporter
MNPHGLQHIVIALVLGTLCYIAARRIHIPAILFYLLAGLFAGPAFLGVIDTQELGAGMLTLVEIVVAVILFEGGLSLKSREFRSAPSAIPRVLGLTIPLTAVSAAFLGHYVLGLDWDISLVFGTLIVVTGPTVIGPLLKSVKFVPKVEILLMWESTWGDVLGVLLSALALEFILLAEGSPVGAMGLQLLLVTSAGLLVGGFGGFLLGRYILPWVSTLGEQGLPGIVAFASALGLFYGANLLAPSSGPLAAAVAGFTLAWFRGKELLHIRHFKDQISIILISTMFVLLSAHVDPFRYGDRLWAMLFVALALGAVARPVAVWLSLFLSELNLRERLYVGLIGPRGIVALATASYASLMVPARGEQLSLMLNAVFLIILLSGAFATLAGKPLASRLRLTIPPNKSSLLLVGANPFSMELVRFAKRYVQVAFLDTSRDTCQLVAEEGHEPICPDVLDDEVYENAKEEGYDRLLALTDDNVLNQLICEKAALHLGQGNVYMAKGDSREGLVIETMSEYNIAFSDRFYIKQALLAMNSGSAHMDVLQPDGLGENTFPLLQVDKDNGLTIVREGSQVKGPSLCIRFRQFEGEASGDSANS